MNRTMNRTAGPPEDRDHLPKRTTGGALSRGLAPPIGELARRCLPYAMGVLVALVATACGGAPDTQSPFDPPPPAQLEVGALVTEPPVAQPSPVPVEGMGSIARPPTPVSQVPQIQGTADALGTEIAASLGERVAQLQATQTALAMPTDTPEPTDEPRAGRRANDDPGDRDSDADSERANRANDDRDQDGDSDDEGDEDEGSADPAGDRSEASPPPEDDSLLGRLRRGGHVIYLRHTRTDWDHDERPWVEEAMEDPALFGDCDRQRQLTDAGRDQARAIGEAFRSQGIPVGDVYSSAWCRTQETARLAFGGVRVVSDRMWDTGYLPEGSDERDRYEEALDSLLSDRPSDGSNTVLVGHMPQLRDATGIALEEGEAAVFEPESDGEGYHLLRRVTHDGWTNLP